MAGALDVIQVIVEMFLLGQRVLNVYEMISSDAVPDTELEDDMLVFFSDLYQELNANLTDDLTFNGLIIKNLSEGTDIGEFPWPGLPAGGSTTDPLPPGVAGLLTFPCAQLGTRGRKFIPGLSEGNTTGGVFVGGVLTALASFGTMLITEFPGDVSGSIWSYVVIDKDGIPRAPVSADVSNVPAYQRRRKQGVGE